MKYRSSIVDIASLFLLVLLSFVFSSGFVDFDTHPIEDAAMLMRYAQHFADGHGIVWNIGEPPVDGATDFLFMVAVGLLVRLGISVELATRFLGFSAHVLNVGLVYISLRKLFYAPMLIAFGTGLFVMVGPGFYYVVAYFGTTFFALSACLSWLLALIIIQKGENQTLSFLFALSSLVTGLIRPEGVFLSFFMLLSIVLIRGWGNSRYTIKVYAGVFLVLGGIYLLWRWQYFGYPLPNPYYKKGGGKLYWDSLQMSYLNALFMVMLLLPAFVTGLLFKKTLRRTIAFLIPLLGFVTLFILIANDMNIRGRFQYVILPMAAMVWWGATEGIRELLKPAAGGLWAEQRNALNLVLAVMVLSAATKFQSDIWRVRYYHDGKYEVGMLLSEYEAMDLRIATSEAGLLPLYSRLEALDTWGLNDKWIAHNGRVTEEYLNNFNPHIIMFHAYFSPVASSHGSPAWDTMTFILRDYAQEHGYILAASFGENPYDTEYYYVRSDFPKSAEIVRRIREVEYYSGITGGRFMNYAPDPNQ